MVVVVVVVVGGGSFKVNPTSKPRMKQDKQMVRRTDTGIAQERQTVGRTDGRKGG